MEPSTAQKERVARRARTGSGAGVGEKGNSAIARRFISLPKHSYGVVIIMPVDVFQSLSRCMCSIYTHRRCYDRSCGGVLGLLDFFRTRRVLGEANLFFNFEDLQCHRERRQMCIGTSFVLVLKIQGCFATLRSNCERGYPRPIRDLRRLLGAMAQGIASSRFVTSLEMKLGSAHITAVQ